MKLRLERAAWEMEQAKQYNHYVINDQVEACADRILQIIAQVAD
jgi:guanylate kinase